VARQQAAANQGASKLAHSKGASLECGSLLSLLPPSFGEACFALCDPVCILNKPPGIRHRICETAYLGAQYAENVVDVHAAKGNGKWKLVSTKKTRSLTGW
jgi:hypothetical protein